MRADTEPRVVIDPGQRLGPPPVGQHKPAHHVQLPQLHRRPTLPPLPLAVPAPPRGVDQAQPHQSPIHRRLARHRLHTPLRQLEGQPPRTPPRMRRPQPRDRHLDIGADLMRTRPGPMRTITQALQTTGLIPGQPGMHGLAGHPEPGRHLRHRRAVADHRQHRLIPLLRHTQLPHEPGVSPINRSRRNPSTETPVPISRRPNGTPQPE